MAKDGGPSPAEQYGILCETTAYAFDLAVKTHFYLFETKRRNKELVFQAQLISAALLTGQLPDSSEES